MVEELAAVDVFHDEAEPILSLERVGKVLCVKNKAFLSQNFSRLSTLIYVTSNSCKIPFAKHGNYFKFLISENKNHIYATVFNLLFLFYARFFFDDRFTSVTLVAALCVIVRSFEGHIPSGTDGGSFAGHGFPSECVPLHPF